MADILIPTAAMELASRVSDPTTDKIDRGLIQKAKFLIWSPAAQTPYDANPANVSSAIEAAFKKLDGQIVDAPLEILCHNVDQDALKKKLIPDMTQHPLATSSIQITLSGKYS